MVNQMTIPTQHRPDAVPTSVRRRRARELADDYGGVLSRALLRGCDVDHEMVRREIAAERWMGHGHQTVAMTTAPLSAAARRWRAVWETGLKVAALDGTTALQHAGLTGFDDGLVHLSVKHTAEVTPLDGVRIHKVIRRLEHEVIHAGIPRTRPSVAAVRAAHWAVSDRQAALVLVMPVQQRLCTGAQLEGGTGAGSSTCSFTTSPTVPTRWASSTWWLPADGGGSPSRRGRWCAASPTEGPTWTSRGRRRGWSSRSTARVTPKGYR
jgi:hypothetical protein